MPIVAIEIWTPTECAGQCRKPLNRSADAMKDTTTEEVYCLDCGSEIEEYDYTQHTRYTDSW